MKKIIAVTLAVLMLLPSLSVGAEQQLNFEDFRGFFTLFSELSIIEGDPDGNLRTEDPVTRAEFVKMAVAASPYSKIVAKNLKISTYKDMPAGHWAAPYVRVAAQYGLVKGYTDATFRPDNFVTYEEAVTVLLKVLGFTDEDFGNAWPYGQVSLAEQLELDKYAEFSLGQQLNRREVAILLYAALDTKMKSGAGKLINVFDVVRNEDVTLIATNREDPSVGGGKICTSVGTYDLPDDFDTEQIGRTGILFVKNDRDMLAFVPNVQSEERYAVTSASGGDLILDGKVLDLDENFPVYYKSAKMTYSSVVAQAEAGDTFCLYRNENGIASYGVLLVDHGFDSGVAAEELEKHIVYSLLDQQIVTYCGGRRTTLSVTAATSLYENNLKSTYGAKKAAIEMGDVLYVKRKPSGEIDYLTYEEGNVIGPTTVLAGTDLSGVRSTKILRNGKEETALQLHDVIYQIPDLNMTLAYSNKITGIYENAEPNQDVPDHVTVSGVSYKIESGTAFTKLSSGGSFRFGDPVILLLGKNNEIADVISPSAVSTDLYGYIYETGKKEYTRSDLTNYTAYYIKVVTADGQTNEYIANKDYDSFKNTVKRITFDNGVAKANSYQNSVSVSGKVDAANQKIGSQVFSSDLKIVDVSTVDPKKNASFTSVFSKRLDGVNIPAERVLYAEKDSKNQITRLILNDATGDAYSYGVVTDVQKESYSYSYDIGGVSRTFNSMGTLYSVSAGQAAKFSFLASGGVQSMQALTLIDAPISDLTYFSLSAGNKTYPISDRAVVYQKDSRYRYTMIALSDLLDGKKRDISAYYDKNPADGGAVRILVVN